MFHAPKLAASVLAAAVVASMSLSTPSYADPVLPPDGDPIIHTTHGDDVWAVISYVSSEVDELEDCFEVSMEVPYVGELKNRTCLPDPSPSPSPTP